MDTQPVILSTTTTSATIIFQQWQVGQMPGDESELVVKYNIQRKAVNATQWQTDATITHEQSSLGQQLTIEKPSPWRKSSVVYQFRVVPITNNSEEGQPSRATIMTKQPESESQLVEEGISSCKKGNILVLNYIPNVAYLISALFATVDLIILCLTDP